MPPLGPLIGAALGAGAGALVLERAGGRKTWVQSTKIGAGAAAGRFVASLLKTGFAVVIALVLVVAVVW
jgi:hypothetical protein